jgi:acid phosphatase (class A)
MSKANALRPAARGVASSIALALCLVACAHAREAVHAPTPIGTNAERTAGYLEAEERPDSVALLPPPPAADSAAFAADEAAYRATRALRDTPRWQFAIADSDVKFPGAERTFACALGVPIDADSMPDLYVLLRRVMVDAGKSTQAAKDRYARTRPFVAHGDSSCVPADEKTLRSNGSYPSGHASAGWAWGLVLAEIAPDRAESLLARGHQFGQSRVICGVHWQSDVDAARKVATAVVERLHSEEEFTRQLAAAREEVAAARRRGASMGTSCALESAAFASDLSARPEH